MRSKYKNMRQEVLTRRSVRESHYHFFADLSCHTLNIFSFFNFSGVVGSLSLNKAYTSRSSLLLLLLLLLMLLLQLLLLPLLLLLSRRHPRKADLPAKILLFHLADCDRNQIISIKVFRIMPYIKKHD